MFLLFVTTHTFFLTSVLDKINYHQKKAAIWSLQLSVYPQIRLRIFDKLYDVLPNQIWILPTVENF